jgi:hypothetical protein
MLTLREIQEKLKRYDEVSLLEVLDISSEDIVEKFLERIEERYDELLLELDEYEDEDDNDETDSFGY